MNLRLARWPVHLPPEPLESLSSWLTRLAGVYGLTVRELLADLCAEADVTVGTVSGLLDIDPPPPVLAVLAERTGVAVPRLRTMTLWGWAPWLFDRLAAREFEEYETFDNYVRCQSVLLLPGAQGRNAVHGLGRWAGPWQPRIRRPRACPACAVDPGRGRALVWSLPLMISCVEHRCRLERFAAVAAGTRGDPLPPVAVAEDVSRLDGYTFAALTTGMVELPGRTVHAGVWFRLLRCLLDELAIAGWAASARARAIVERVWDCADYPTRAGLAVWPAYEHMDWEI
ncbi:TniQ family protein [Nocardia tengchongensis]|uniref:TniQ family protein n=1 Tax=Nocardia tengchongensis TaxID=2055889 RepID=UPI00360B50EA